MSDPVLEVYYDGACALCLREIHWIQRLDRRGRIVCIDIADEAFEPEAVGVPWETLMARLHGRLPDGQWLTGVEVFRRIYSAVGFGWLVAITRWPGISHALDVAYDWFAANRLRLTGRCMSEACDLRGGVRPGSGEPTRSVGASVSRLRA